MKKIFFIPAMALSLFSTAQNGAQIEFKISSSKGITGSCTIKSAPDWGSKIALDMNIPQLPTGGIHTLSLMKQDSPDIIYAINENAKTYSETKRSNDREDKNTYTVKKIGEEKINGYNCVHALVTEGGETSDVWNTKDFPEYSKYANAINASRHLGSQKRQQALKEAGCDGMPVKMVHKSGREGDMTLELVKFDKKSFTKADFELPAGYTKSNSGAAGMGAVKTQQEMMSMTPEERAKYIEEMKKQYGKKD